MRKFTEKNKYGFSLIETLIAVSILMIAIAGPLSLVQAGLFSSIHQRNQVTATYLAQEAIEFVKNLRDTNSYYQYDPIETQRDWLAGPNNGPSLLTTCGSGNGCYVDPHQKLPNGTGGVFVYAYDVPRPLWMNVYNKDVNNNGIFAYDYNISGGGTQTSFIRTVKITAVSTYEVTLSVTVGWMDNALPRSHTVSTNLYNYEIADAEVVTPPPSGPEVIGKMVLGPQCGYVFDITNAPGFQAILPGYITITPLCQFWMIVISTPGYTVTSGSFSATFPGPYPGGFGEDGVTVTSNGGSGSVTIGQMHFRFPGCPIATAPITNAPGHQIIPPSVTADYGANCYLEEITINDSGPGYEIKPFPFGDYISNPPGGGGSFLPWPWGSSIPITYPNSTANFGGDTGKFWGTPVQYLIVTTP